MSQSETEHVVTSFYFTVCPSDRVFFLTKSKRKQGGTVPKKGALVNQIEIFGWQGLFYIKKNNDRQKKTAKTSQCLLL